MNILMNLLTKGYAWTGSVWKEIKSDVDGRLETISQLKGYTGSTWKEILVDSTTGKLKVIVDSIPSVSISSLPSVNISSLPNVVISSLPNISGTVVSQLKGWTGSAWKEILVDATTGKLKIIVDSIPDIAGTVVSQLQGYTGSDWKNVLVDTLGRVIVSKSTYPATGISSNRATINSSATTNIDVPISFYGDLMGFLIEFSQYIPADYISSIRILGSDDSVKHIISNAQLHVNASRSLEFNPDNSIFRNISPGDKVRFVYVSTSTTSQIVDCYTTSARGVTTS